MTSFSNWIENKLKEQASGPELVKIGQALAAAGTLKTKADQAKANGPPPPVDPATARIINQTGATKPVTDSLLKFIGTGNFK